MSDVVELWRKASLTVIEAKSIQKKLKNIHNKFTCARKRAKKSKRTFINEDWFFKLFDLSKCRCDIPDSYDIYSTKVNCFVTRDGRDTQFLS